jgi:two-component system, sensor histidine kinase PdtaS
MSSAADTRGPSREDDLKRAMRPLLKPGRRWQAADTVVAASATLIAIIAAFFVLLCIDGYNTRIERAETRGQLAASTVAEGTRWVISSALVVMDGLATSLEHDIANASARTLTQFESIVAAIPAQMELGIYDRSGNVIAGASSRDLPASIADQDYFAEIAGGANWSLSAQANSEATGDPTFSVARRLATSDGTFTGAIVIAVDGNVLGRIAETLDLGPASTVSIIRSDGWVIARRPPLPAPLDLSGTTAFKNLNAGEVGSYMSQTSPADGVSRIVSFRRVDDLGYVAVASIALDTVLADLWRGIWIVSLLLAPIAGALLIGSFMTARLLRRSESTSRSLAAALEHNQTLFQEIHHRVKNNLQSVTSLLQLQPIPAEVKTNMSQRIAAMSAVHEHIYRSGTFSTVYVRDYLRTLIENIRAGYDPNVAVVEEIEDVAVDKDAATPLGLIVNEIVSNSFKHAFADGRAGTVTVTLAAMDGGRAKLTIRDNGLGFDPSAPSTGIGRRLIRGFVAQLQGEAQTSADGTEFTLTFPLAKAQA